MSKGTTCYCHLFISRLFIIYIYISIKIAYAVINFTYQIIRFTLNGQLVD